MLEREKGGREKERKRKREGERREREKDIQNVIVSKGQVEMALQGSRLKVLGRVIREWVLEKARKIICILGCHCVELVENTYFSYYS